MYIFECFKRVELDNTDNIALIFCGICKMFPLGGSADKNN